MCVSVSVSVECGKLRLVLTVLFANIYSHSLFPVFVVFNFVHFLKLIESMNQAAILTVASLVGGVSNFAESIHGFAPYSFMTDISKILTSNGVRHDEFFEDLAQATNRWNFRLFIYSGSKRY